VVRYVTLRKWRIRYDNFDRPAMPRASYVTQSLSLTLIQIPTREVAVVVALLICRPDDKLRPCCIGCGFAHADSRIAASPLPAIQKCSTHGRTSTSHDQALRGWRIRCR